MNRSLRDFAALCGGRYAGEDRPYTAVSTDTRSLRGGEIYLALRGPRFDGNDFLSSAAASGAVAAVVDRAVRDAPLPLIEVADGQEALSAAARGWRGRFGGVVVGVAGSNGKTTVKEMIAAILSRRGACLATRGNLNNHIGVPLTLLRLTDEHRSAVIEIGANRSGEVAALVEIAQPDVGLITNAGAEHLEGFGDLDGVARAEGEMVAGLGAGDVAVINADDDYAGLWRSMTTARVVTFGLDNAADFSAAGVTEELTDAGFRVGFRLRAPQGECAVRLNVGGRHNLRNALAAAAAAVSAGATLDDVAAGLAAMQPVAGRLQPGRTAQGARLIDDSYNANPSSMRAGIDVLTGMPGSAWLVMGDMGELGDHARGSHEDIGRYARERGVQRLFATGPLSTLAVESFGAGASWFPDTESLARAVNELLTPEVTLLVKGSRSNRLERVVASLTGASAKEMHLIMLYWLAQQLAPQYSAFNAFSYLTLRAILAVASALLISLLIGQRMINWLSRYQVGQQVRDDGPQTHLKKAGTPTMGGALIIVSIIIATLLWADLGNRHVWIAVGVLVSTGLVGFYDDYLKLVVRNAKGLAARWKYFWLSVASIGAALLLWHTARTPAETTLFLPFLKNFAWPLGTLAFVVLSYLMIVGMSNAVNLTDGLDGLAIVPAVMVAGALAIFAYLSGNAIYAPYLGIPALPGVGEVGIFCSAIVGAGLGFLWFNTYPAQVFMGDVGALALGAALGVVAVMVRQEVVALLMGGIFVLETASVILQVASFKLRGKRIFRMAPIHHHFELKGWAEPKVIVRFWIISLLLVLAGLATLKLR